MRNLFAELLDVVKTHVPLHQRPAFYRQVLKVLGPHGISLAWLKGEDPALDAAHNDEKGSGDACD